MTTSVGRSVGWSVGVLGVSKKTHDQVFSSFDLITQAISMQKNSLTPIFETETHRFVLNTEPFLRVIRKPRILSPKFRFIVLIIITLFKGITSYISFFPKISFLSMYNFYFSLFLRLFCNVTTFLC